MQVRVNGKVSNAILNGPANTHQHNWHSGITLHPALFRIHDARSIPLITTTMPPILHPRSRSTSSLFAATMVASFVIVGLPHIFPCPAPRRTLADSQVEMTADGQQIMRPRRRRKNPDIMQQDELQYTKEVASTKGVPTQFADSSADEVATFLQMEAEAESLARIGRECPVPKPRGIVGQLLGFSNNSNDTTDNRQQEQSKHNIAVHENGS